MALKPSRLGPGQRSIERGSTFESDRSELARHSSPARRAISPASLPQRRKVQGLPCVVCGQTATGWVAIDPSHLCPRRKGGCDHEDCVLPMCRTAGTGGCHEAYERGDLDLLRVLAANWPTYKVEVQHMLEHLEPVTMLEQLAGDRTQWSGL